MNVLNRSLAQLTPFAGVLALALVLPVTVKAQSAPNTPTTAEANAVKDLPLDRAERQQFVGTYLLSMPGSEGRTMPFRVYEEEGALYGQPLGGQAMRLMYQGENRFRPEKERESLMTFAVEGGKVIHFSVVTPQGTLQGMRESKRSQ
jgi:hypothetical protein